MILKYFDDISLVPNNEMYHLSKSLLLSIHDPGFSDVVLLPEVYKMPIILVTLLPYCCF